MITFVDLCRRGNEKGKVFAHFGMKYFPLLLLVSPLTPQPAKANPQMKCSGTSEKSPLYTFIKQQTR